MPPSVPVRAASWARSAFAPIGTRRSAASPSPLCDVPIGIMGRAAPATRERPAACGLPGGTASKHNAFRRCHLGLLMRHLEMVVAYSIISRMRGSDCCRGAPGSPASCGTDRPGPGRLLGRRGMIRGPANRFFADLLVGHGVAAARRAIAVNHQDGPIAIGLVVDVGKPVLMAR